LAENAPYRDEDLHFYKENKMPDLQIQPSIRIIFSSDDFSIIAKALTGTLKKEGPELIRARELGLELLKARQDRAETLLQSFRSVTDRVTDLVTPTGFEPVLTA